ncbi:MAG: DUF2018 family protein [Campylobacterales bacterium]|nr:DUF2018 family protein [Campylobacterales bacterium]
MNEEYFDNMLFGGSPISKFLDILKHANANLTSAEFEKFMFRVATVEAILEAKGISEQEIATFAYEEEEKIRQLANSLAMSVTADILTQNE